MYLDCGVMVVRIHIQQMAENEIRTHTNEYIKTGKIRVSLVDYINASFLFVMFYCDRVRFAPGRN